MQIQRAGLRITSRTTGQNVWTGFHSFPLPNFLLMWAGQQINLVKTGVLTVTTSVLTCLLMTASPVHAGQCSELARLAQQSAAHYRNSGNQHHYAAARNYQNAYNGCVNAVRQRTSAVTGRQGSGATSAFDITMNVLSTLNSLSKGAREQRDYERAVAEEARRQEELVRRQEAELQRELEAARRALEERERQARERERQQRAEAAALSSRCAKANPFGRDSSACDGQHTGPSPFAKAESGADSPFARSDNSKPDWDAGRRKGGSYDSVNGIDCLEMFVRGCIPDSWRQMLARLQDDHNGDINAALLAAYDRQQAAQSDASLYSVAYTESQYRRLGTGDATYEDIERENSTFDFEPVTLSSLEAKLAEIENDPETKRQFQKALREIAGQ